MKINVNEFRNGKGQPAEAPVDFSQLCASLSAHQAATPTAQLANSGSANEATDSAAAVAVFRTEPGWESAAAAKHGSFHAAAAARFNSKPA